MFRKSGCHELRVVHDAGGFGLFGEGLWPREFRGSFGGWGCLVVGLRDAEQIAKLGEKEHVVRTLRTTGILPVGDE